MTPVDSPVSAAFTDWLVVPEPTDCVEVLVKDESDGLVPHSKPALVDRPFAVTFPFRVAVVAPTDVAARVVTAGAAPGVKLRILPLVVPEPLLAATR